MGPPPCPHPHGVTPLCTHPHGSPRPGTRWVRLPGQEVSGDERTIRDQEHLIPATRSTSDVMGEVWGRQTQDHRPQWSQFLGRKRVVMFSRLAYGAEHSHPNPNISKYLGYRTP